MIFQSFFSSCIRNGSRNIILQPYKKMGDGPSTRVVVTRKPTNFDKRILVWTGKYKSVAEVPNEVGPAVMDRARNRFRIKVANYTMAATALGCILMILLGKRAQERGETVGQMSQDWHKQLKEDASVK